MGFDIGGAIGGIIGGLAGNSIASGDFSTARGAADQAYQEMLAIGVPPETAKPLVLQKFQQAGQLTPQLEQYINQGPSAVAGISEDPALKQRQMSALNLITQRSTGGLDAGDRQKLNEMQNQVAKDQEAKQQQIIQQYQQRGMGGAGAELAAALQQSQAGANQSSAEGDKIAALASQNALQAALQSGQLAGNIRTQDFNVADTKASAQDQMNRFNIQNQQAAQQRNIASQNQAQQYNLTNAQNLSNANTGMTNEETARQNQAKVDDWNNQIKRARLRSGTYQEKSNDFQNRGQRTANQYATIGSALGQGIGAAMGAPSAPKPSVENVGSWAGEQGSYSAGGAADDPSMFASMAAHGDIVPGKAKVEGDSRANDVVPYKLSPGEIVIPRSIVQSKNAPFHAADFVAMMKRIQQEG